MKKSYDDQKNKKLVVVEKNKIHQLNIEDIAYIHSEGGLSSIKILDKKDIHVVKTLKQFEIELGGIGFVRVNRNELVNCLNIDEYFPKQKTIILKNKKNIKVSFRQSKEIKECFSN